MKYLVLALLLFPVMIFAADIPPSAQFLYQVDAQNTMIVSVNGVGSVCTPSCLSYDWTWGDGNNSTGMTSTHTYSAPGTYPITLTVSDSFGMASKTQNVTVSMPDHSPVLGGTFKVDVNAWVVEIPDSSTDDHAITTVRLVWGDGSLTQNGPAGTVFTHLYKNPGSFTATRTVFDNRGQESKDSVTATFATFTLSGKVLSASGLIVRGATIKLSNVAMTKTTTSSATGDYTFLVLKPGTYTLSTIKAGMLFQDSLVTVGPTSIVNITANK